MVLAPVAIAMGTRDVVSVREIAVRMRREHRAIERALAVLSASASGLRVGLVPKHVVEDAIFELFLIFDDHLVEEERLLGPVVPWLLGDDAARVHLVLGEHDDQRTLLLSTLESTEQGTLSREELLDVANRLVCALRADLELEAELFDDLGQRTSTR